MRREIYINITRIWNSKSYNIKDNKEKDIWSKRPNKKHNGTNNKQRI